MKEILCVGLEEQALNPFDNLSKDVRIRRIGDSDQLDDYLDGELDQVARSIFCAGGIRDLPEMELAQYLRSNFPRHRLVYIAQASENKETENLKKNGFTDVYLLPTDLGILQRELKEIEVQLTGNGTIYKPVQLIDVQPNSAFDFSVSVYLPLNNKYVRLVKPGGNLSEQKYNKLNDEWNGTAYVDAQEMDSFYEYCAERLADLSSDDSQLSSTERKVRLQESVRGIFSNIFDSYSQAGSMDDGKEIMEQTNKIINTYILKTSSINMAQQIKNVVSEGRDHYSHSSNVSSLAYLIATALEVEEPENLAIAGMFHDIALAELSGPISEEEMSSLSPEDQQIYREHPAAAVNDLRKRRITITEKIAMIIEQHHEHADGTGFPKNMNWPRICIEAQILMFADQFEHLMQVKDGEKQPDPMSALKAIQDKGWVSREVTGKIRRFFESLQASDEKKEAA